MMAGHAILSISTIRQMIFAVMQKGEKMTRKYIDADILEASGWVMSRIRPDSETAMVHEIKKPTDFPAADVRENVRGEWIALPDGKIVCSNCYENPTNRIIIGGNIVYDMTPIKVRMKFCSNCGADMRGGKYED